MTRPESGRYGYGSLGSPGRRIEWMPLILAVYLAAFVYFWGKMLFYSRYVGRFPDELAHISYIAYLTAHPGLFIPRFRDMQLLVLKNSSAAANTLTAVNGLGGSYTLSGSFNYLCHPPLYYQIMRLSGGVTFTGGIFRIDLMKLRLFSMGLASCGLLLFFHIGRSRLGNRPLPHLLYAVICVSVPMFAYDCAGVNNDALTLPAMGLTALGLLRLAEKRRNAGTYGLVGAGVALAVLSKYTAGLTALLATVFACAGIAIRERSLDILRRRAVWAALPFCLAAVAYMAAVYRQTGSIQPDFRLLRPQEFMASGFYVPVGQRAAWRFPQYAVYFATGFFHTWTDITSAVTLYKGETLLGPARIGIFLIAVLPMLLLWPRRTGRGREKSLTVLRAGYFAVALVALTQLVRGYVQFRHVSGYLGGYQSRYYLCDVVWMGLAAAWEVKELAGPPVSAPDAAGQPPALARRVWRGARQAAASLWCVGFSVLLIYEDLIYFIWNFKDYLK